MVTKYTHKDLVWVDLESPTQEEVREIMREYSINPLVADELLQPSVKPKVDFHENFIYLIMHFPAFKHTHNKNKNQEVDFIIGRKFLITVRYDTIDPIHKFSKVFEVNSILERGDIGNHAGYLFFHMIKKLYKSVDHELAYIRDSLSFIEDRIFEGKEKAMVIEISKVSRELLNFKLATDTHKEILESFDNVGRQFFGVEFIYHIKSISGEYFKIHNEIRMLIESLAELRETNNSLLTTKQNEIMKVLTIMAFITFPLSVIASIFGMNTKTLPIVGKPNDFWIIMGIMGFATIMFFALFKYKKWL